jgi:hypothetical protein
VTGDLVKSDCGAELILDHVGVGLVVTEGVEV